MRNKKIEKKIADLEKKVQSQQTRLDRKAIYHSTVAGLSTIRDMNEEVQEKKPDWTGK